MYSWVWCLRGSGRGAGVSLRPGRWRDAVDRAPRARGCIFFGEPVKPLLHRGVRFGGGFELVPLAVDKQLRSLVRARHRCYAVKDSFSLASNPTTEPNIATIAMKTMDNVFMLRWLLLKNLSSTPE